MSQLTKVIRERFDDAKTLINSQFSIEAYLNSRGYAISNNRQIRCPFHDDSTPSFSVDTTNNVWKCFGCPDGGHFIDLWIRYENKYNGGSFSIYSATEAILRSHPEIQASLGFTSIYQSEDTQFNLFEKTPQNTFNFEEKLRRPSTIKLTSTDSMKKVLDKLRNESIDLIIAFIADCERGMTEEQLISKYYQQKANLSDFIIENTTSEEETHMFAEAFMEALNS